MATTTKLISVRIETETLRAIDAFVDKHHYLNRNLVINNFLTNLFRNGDEDDIYNVIVQWHKGLHWRISEIHDAANM